METQFKPKATPKDVFMHLLAIGTLYASTGSLISILFDFINHYLPDVLEQSPFFDNGSSIRASMALLIVVFPVYVWLTRYLNQDMASNPEKQNLGIRKWLTNLTLFIAAIVIIGDLVTLIHNFLNGEVTPRFLAKIFVVFLVAIAIFAYYRNKQTKIIAWLAIVLAIASIIAGFFVAGSPFAARRARLDQQRVGDLQNIQSQIVNYWQNKGNLPASLDDLADSISGFIVPVDAETGQPYEYSIQAVDNTPNFELCATFATISGPSSANGYTKPIMPTPIYSPEFSGRGQPLLSTWDHPLGHTCFTRTIDPDFYPVNKPSPKQ